MKFIRWLKAFMLHQMENQERLGVIRDLLWNRQARRDSEAVISIATKLDLRPLPLNEFRMSDTKDNRTLFILGSGYSINELSPWNFEEIRGGISVGINVWIAHDFVPDVYSLEPTYLPISSVQAEQNHYRSERLNRTSVIRHNPKFLILRPPKPSTTEQFVKIPEPLHHRSFVYGRANLPTVSGALAEAELSRFIHQFLREDYRLPVLPDNGASVIRLIFLGLKLRFEKIVLLGVDFNEKPYFWFHPDWRLKRPELAEIFPRPSGIPHETTLTRGNSGETRPYNSLEVIKWINSFLQVSRHAKMFVGSPESALSDFLPTYYWNH